MARTIKEIKKGMTDQFMSDNTLRESYGITGEDATWENTFSTVSLENLLMYIVAVCAYSIEVLMDGFRKEVDEQVAQNIVPTTRWYYTKARQFQLGDSLVYDEATEQYKYPTVDETKQIVQYCAVKDRGGSIQVLAAKDGGGQPAVLSSTEKAAFTSYMNSIKVAGVILDVQSLEADSIEIQATVQVNPQVIATDGSRVSDGTMVVEEAVKAYLAGIVYGGTFNKTKCVDAIQNVEGVLDVTLGTVKAKAAADVSYTTVTGNNYTAVAGCFIAQNLQSSISYVV